MIVKVLRHEARMPSLVTYSAVSEHVSAAAQDTLTEDGTCWWCDVTPRCRARTHEGMT